MADLFADYRVEGLTVPITMEEFLRQTTIEEFLRRITIVAEEDPSYFEKHIKGRMIGELAEDMPLLQRVRRLTHEQLMRFREDLEKMRISSFDETTIDPN